jgi:predicted O-methyltransferase YrrM
MSVTNLVYEYWLRLRHPALAPSFATPTHLTIAERVALCRLAKAAPHQTLVEIGSYLGASALALAAGLRGAGNAAARIYCIDTWENTAMTEGSRDTFAEFARHTAPFASRIEPVRGWSTDVAGTLLPRLGLIDLLFIDGDHSYEGVLADWRTYSPALAPGATLVFHDIGWAEGVQQVISKEVRPRVSSEGRLPNLWWGRLA